MLKKARSEGLSKLSRVHCGILFVLLVNFKWKSLFACQYLCGSTFAVEDEGLCSYTCCDISLVHNVKSPTFLESSSGSIQCLTPDCPQSTCHVSPSSPSQRPLTDQLQTWQTWSWTELYTALQQRNDSERWVEMTNTQLYVIPVIWNSNQSRSN